MDPKKAIMDALRQLDKPYVPEPFIMSYHQYEAMRAALAIVEFFRGLRLASN